MHNANRLKQNGKSIRIKKVISIVVGLFFLLVGYYFLNSITGLGIPCPFYKLTGYKCPGCGITRALFSLLEGDIKSSFNYNPLIYVLSPFLITYFIYKTYLYINNKKQSIIATKIINIIGFILIIITILFGILRNIY